MKARIVILSSLFSICSAFYSCTNSTESVLSSNDDEQETVEVKGQHQITYDQDADLGIAPDNYSFNQDIPYMDYHDKFSHERYIPNIGTVVASRKEGTKYVFTYNTGWEESITVDECTLCNGDGGGVCAFCNGTGYQQIGSSQPIIVGDLYIPPAPPMQCTYCGGTGYATCQGCRGRGETVTVIAINKKNRLIYTSLLGNRGTMGSLDETHQYHSSTQNNTINNNSSEPSSYDSKWIECPLCHGTGKCSSCAGRGEKRLDDGTPYDCWLCKGGGQCTSCHGKGRIRL